MVRKDGAVEVQNDDAVEVGNTLRPKRLIRRKEVVKKRKNKAKKINYVPKPHSDKIKIVGCKFKVIE